MLKMYLVDMYFIENVFNMIYRKWSIGNDLEFW